jgi:hypothetical protein
VTAPIHASPSLPVARSADAVHRHLVAAPQVLATEATADALQRSGPLLRGWGLVPSALPTVTAAPTTAGELGSIAVRWRGDERVTGWPATSAWLIVTPAGPRDSLLTIATSRTPTRGLAIGVLDRLHGERATALLVSGFLRTLRDHVEQATGPEHAAGRPLEPLGGHR